MSESHLTDARVVQTQVELDPPALVAAGLNDAALAHVFSRYGVLVVRWAERIFRDQATAEDVLHEVMLRLLRKGASFAALESEAQKRSWLHSTTLRICWDMKARRRKERDRADMAMAFEGDRRAEPFEERNLLGGLEVATQLGSAVDLSSKSFIAIDSGEIRERGGDWPDHRVHRLSTAAGVAFTPLLKGRSGFGQALSLDYAWMRRPAVWALTVGLSLYRESFPAASAATERVSYQISAGVRTPPLITGEVELHAGLELTGTWTKQDGGALEADSGGRISSFQRVGTLATMSLGMPLSSLLGWTLKAGVNPTFFFEHAPNGADSGQHIEMNTVFSLTTGMAFGY